MRSELKIERALVSDHAAIVVLLEEVELPPDGIEDHLEDFFIIRHPEAVAGPEFLIGSVGIEAYGESALLRSLAVHPDYQKRGVGRALITDGLKFARRNGMKTLYLLTDTARDYLVSLGFQETSRDTVPQKIRDTIEFSSLCPSTSTCLSMSLE